MASDAELTPMPLKLADICRPAAEMPLILSCRAARYAEAARDEMKAAEDIALATNIYADADEMNIYADSCAI